MPILRRLLRPAFLASALAAIGLLLLALAALEFVGSAGFAYDFHAYDLAARRIASGELLYPAGVAQAYNSGRYEGLYLYPPPLAIALLPLTSVGGEYAAELFFAIRIVLLVAGCAVLPVRAEVRLATLGVACLSLPVLHDLNVGNMSVVVFAAAAALWRWQDRPVGGAIAAGLMAIRPPFAILLVGWLARGPARRVGWTIVAGLVMVALTVPIVGISGWADYVTILRTLGSISTGPHNLSLTSTASTLGLAEPVASACLLGGYALALGATVYASRRRDPDVAIVVALGATLLVTPFIHSHYLTLLLLPAALLADRGRPWCLVVPLLGWLPDVLLPIAAVVGLLLPLLAPDRNRWRQRGVSGLGVAGTGPI